jgi:hypothetical protein
MRHALERTLLTYNESGGRVVDVSGWSLRWDNGADGLASAQRLFVKK